MNIDIYGTTFFGPHLTIEKIVNTGGIYIITPIILTGSFNILDIGQAKHLIDALSSSENFYKWSEKSAEFGGFAFFVHYELNESKRNQTIHQINQHSFIKSEKNLTPVYANQSYKMAY